MSHFYYVFYKHLYTDYNELFNKGSVVNIFKLSGLATIGILLVNVAFFCGLIYFAFWCAKHFGLIA